MQGLLVAARDEWNLEHLHRAIKHAVHDLETRRPIAPDSGGVTHVASLTLNGRVLEHDIRRLEDLDRKGM